MADDNTDKAIAAEYVLSLLEGAEKRVFEDRLTREPALREKFAAWAEDFSVYDTDEVEPPAHIKADLNLHLFGPPRPAWKKFLAWGSGMAVAGAFALAVVMVVPNYLPQGPDMQTALAAEGLSATFDLYQEDRKLNVVLATATAPAGQDFELWIITEGAAPISLGVITDGDLLIPADIPLDNAILAVTVEAKGGSADGNPTSTPIAVGQFSPV